MTGAHGLLIILLLAIWRVLINVDLVYMYLIRFSHYFFNRILYRNIIKFFGRITKCIKLLVKRVTR